MNFDGQENNELNTQIFYRLVNELSESEKRYRELVENLREIVLESNELGKITFLNRAWEETLGYSIEDSVGQQLIDFIHPEDRDIAAQALNEIYSTTASIDREFRFLHQTKQVIWLNLLAKPSPNKGLSGSLTNITDRKQSQITLQQMNEVLEHRVEERTQLLQKANEQLHQEILERSRVEETLRQTLKQLQQTQTQLIQTEKMLSLGQMVAGIAHEINNPINFIYGNLTHVREYSTNLLELIERYQKSFLNPPQSIIDFINEIDLDFIRTDLTKMLASMKTGTNRIRNIILSLRNFSRLDESDKKAVDLHEGIDNTLLLLKHRCHSDIEIIRKYEDLPLLFCYPAQLNQVFMNIINNALDVLSESIIDRKTIVIQTETNANFQVCIRIRDNGPGIAPEIRDRLFDPFFTTKPVGKGTGLGLAICYQIVTKHQGSIVVNSELGEGTEFAIYLPQEDLLTRERNCDD